MASKSLVWFKKDLRVSDHEPLLSASYSDEVVAVYILEEHWLSSAEFSHNQLYFLTHSLTDLQQALSTYNIPLLIMRGECLDCLTRIHSSFAFNQLYSHMETGLTWTHERDIAVKQWCRMNSVDWYESKQFSVIRKLRSRDTWNKAREKYIERDLHSHPRTQSISINIDNIPNIKLQHLEDIYNTSKLNHIQLGGRSHAIRLLDSFLTQRGMNYTSSMSSPNTAYDECSRLSPHIAWGTISLSEIHLQLTNTYKKLYAHDHKMQWLRSLKAFESRLWWHCHFIQKLESEPNIEFNNINSGFDGMRESEFTLSYYNAWCRGETGFPFIDACMRALIQHGWINFRMRAMLISFACYQLWLHWLKPAHHLARLFTDFEPGIHYSQVQMQSGVTGINAIRIYSPIKQAIDQDPDGKFIRQYCPELANLSNENIHQPHLTPPLEQIACGVIIGEHYPYPIIDHAQCYQTAKQKIYQWKSKQQTKQLSRQVYIKHGSRKNSHFPKQKRELV